MNGSWITRREKIGNFFVEHFKSICRSSNPLEPTELSNLNHPTIDETDNLMLCPDPDDKDIWEALNQIGSLKASECIILQILLGDRENDASSVVKSFFTNGFMLKELNHTNLVLIPKVENPPSINQFRPIRLYNAAY
ncbi:uncharacterized protein LOC121237678 [Juglans microcarpa x Juglans regia]|uniref:uncharacterized protein LOC121237678 n=1 Tax=Juglans microcarpa x Juglans regia TaxID=2249226 RepID=UPI001B7F70FF|nr:uncharacterized protein LOC121237678 [Juglans microcarpa x Juglans regia]